MSEEVLAPTPVTVWAQPSDLRYVALQGSANAVLTNERRDHLSVELLARSAAHPVEKTWALTKEQRKAVEWAIKTSEAVALGYYDGTHLTLEYEQALRALLETEQTESGDPT